MSRCCQVHKGRKIESKRVLEIIYAGIFTLLVILSGECRGTEAVETSVPIRIGWQIPAATQAQILQVLKRTDVLESHGLEPSLVPFSYGGPQVEAAFAGKLDVFFAGDQPAINLSLAITFALVMLLPFDLDRAGEGLIAVNQQPMIDLYQSMSKRR